MADIEKHPGEESPDCCDRVFSCGCCKAMEKCSDKVVNGMETFFYWIGRLVGKYPWIVIGGTFVFLCIFLPGIAIKFEEETDPLNLWTPLGIETREDKDWVDTYWPSLLRPQQLILAEGTNVLTATFLQDMYTIYAEVEAISVQGQNWQSLCYKLGQTCWATGLLELWSFNQTVISSLTDAEVVSKVNEANLVSPVYSQSFDVTLYLGKIVRDSSGNISSASATVMNFYINASGLVLSTDDPILDWELEFIKVGEKQRSEIDHVYYFAGRSFTDIGGDTIQGDIAILAAGYMILIMFVLAVLGQFNCVGHRVYLTLAGLLCIGFGIIVSMGFCLYIGYIWGPLHSVLPFLVLGVGVDDMFVIIQCYENLNEDIREKPIPERTGMAIKHAGMSVLITSATDVLAFGVGASTVLPALRSFCIYCAVGLGAIFLFSITFFTACLAIDERRRAAMRNACCCCYKHSDDYQPCACSQQSYFQKFLTHIYAPVLIKTPVKVLVLLVAAVLLGVGIWGVTELEQDFDPEWFIPGGNYLSDFLEARDQYFPQDGINLFMYLGPLEYHNLKTQLETLYNNTLTNTYTQSGTVDAWFISFEDYLSENSLSYSSKIDYISRLETYISGDGSRFSSDVVFNSAQTDILASRFSLTLTAVQGSAAEINSMDSIKGECINSGFEDEPGSCFAYSDFFLEYETNRVIQNELFRNLGLAFVCILIMTFILLANLWLCFLVSLCVIMSLVDIGGLMHFWGLTIDTVTTINLIIAIGLTVDYSAHIAHTFMTEVGSRNGRVSATISDIGPAVFFGAFSTLLAFILLAASKSYVFTAFFKVFFLVVSIGVFHGLIFLPTMLSVVGPPPYLSAHKAIEQGHKERAQTARQIGSTKKKEGIDGPYLTAVDQNGELTMEKVNGTSHQQHDSNNPVAVTPSGSDIDKHLNGTDNPAFPE